MTRTINKVIVDTLIENLSLFKSWKCSIGFYGASHSGKTTASKLLSELTGIPILEERSISLPGNWLKTREEWYTSREKKEREDYLLKCLLASKLISEGWCPLQSCFLFVHLVVPYEELEKRAKRRGDAHPEAYLKPSYEATRVLSMPNKITIEIDPKEQEFELTNMDEKSENRTLYKGIWIKHEKESSRTIISPNISSPISETLQTPDTSKSHFFTASKKF